MSALYCFVGDVIVAAVKNSSFFLHMLLKFPDFS